MGFKIVWSPTARLDLKELLSYIAEDDPIIAEKLGLKILDIIEQAARFPNSGRSVPEFHDTSIRELILSSYRIVYRIKQRENLIKIARVWHAARGFPEL